MRMFKHIPLTKLKLAIEFGSDQDKKYARNLFERTWLHNPHRYILTLAIYNTSRTVWGKSLRLWLPFENYSLSDKKFIQHLQTH